MRALLAFAIAAAPTLAMSTDLSVGQTLACTSKNSAKQLYAVVGKIDAIGSHTSVSITLRNLAPGAVPPLIDHLPVDLTALTASCTPTAKSQLPLGEHFEEGYARWRSAVDAHQAGAFTVTVDEIDEMIRTQIYSAQHRGTGS